MPHPTNINQARNDLGYYVCAFFNCIIHLYKEIIWLIYLQPFPIFISTGDIFHIMVNDNLNWSPVYIWAYMGPQSSSLLKEHDHISNTNILQWRITNLFFKWRNPTRINLTWSNFQHILRFLFKFSICRYEKPKQIQLALLWPSTTSHTPSGQTLTVSAPPAQPDIFTLDNSSFPSLSFTIPVSWLLLLSTQHKNFHQSPSCGSSQ